MPATCSPASPLHAAGGLAGGVGRLPADPPGPRRSHPADARRRRGRDRHSAARHAYGLDVPLGSNTSTTGTACCTAIWDARCAESDRRPRDRAGLSRDAGSSRWRRCIVALPLHSRRSALGTAPQPLGRPRCSASSACSGCRFPTSRSGRSSSWSSPSDWAGCRSPARARWRTSSCRPSPWAARWPPS